MRRCGPIRTSPEIAFSCLATIAFLSLLPAGAGRATEVSTAVTYMPAADVAVAFAKGVPLIERDGYKVHASRREGAGKAEVHTKDSDIIYVLEGVSTIITGGEVVDPQSVAPEEIRGASIRGGDARRLVKGDLMIVPNGVPHWFKEVTGPLLYYVVKVRETGGDRR